MERDSSQASHLHNVGPAVFPNPEQVPVSAPGGPVRVTEAPRGTEGAWGELGPDATSPCSKCSAGPPAFSTPQTNKIASSFLRPQGALQPGLPFKANTDAKPVSKSQVPAKPGEGGMH